MNAAELSQKLKQSPILAGCTFWESPKRTVLVIHSSNVGKLVEKIEETVALGYKLFGGVQLIRRDDGNFNGCATFLLPADKPAAK